MSAKIIPFTGITKLDLPPERILDKAAKADLEGCIVLGFAKDGAFYATSSYADGGTIMWLLEFCKHYILNGCRDA